MNTKPTTQQLARELAEILQSRDNINPTDLKELLADGGIRLPAHLHPAIFTAIKAEIDKEAASIKKQLQEALASE